jgi:siderophore synthetase component
VTSARGVTIEEVRRWARARRIDPVRFARAYNDAFLVSVSRLLEAVHRERCAPRSVLKPDGAGQWFLVLGRRPTLRAPLADPLSFRHFEVTSCPWTFGGRKKRAVRTPQAFLTALRRCLRGSDVRRHFEQLDSDFRNSFANLVLNRLLVQQLGAGSPSIEPVYQGHTHYPFPALRIGPSVTDVVENSNLCRQPSALPLVAVRPGRFISTVFDDDRACFRAWAGLSPTHEGHLVIPLHPWQLKLSPVVGELLRMRKIELLDDELEAVPLASQRTCRVVETGFDLKLPIAATLTSQERLLYPLNRENAPIVSALARALLETIPERTLDFQYDVASIAHAEPSIGTHLSAIVRCPVRRREREVVVPALNLWSGPLQARTLLSFRRSDDAYDFFRAYCRVLMRGPVVFYARWGMAFEPHLQNVYVAFREARPTRIVLRDLDSTILDPKRIRPVIRATGLRPAPGTWRHMPAFETGGQRLAHAMVHGHLREVVSYLVRNAEADLARLAGILDETWSELLASDSSASFRRLVCDLRAQSDTVTAMLRMRLTRSPRLTFV